MDNQPHASTAAAPPVELGRLPHQDAPVTPPLEPHVEAGAQQPTALESDYDAPPTPLQMPEPALLRQDTSEPIGPSTDLPTPMIGQQLTGASHTASGPVIIINLLLTSTGTRHPYRIDQKYLTKRGVSAEGEDGAFDPFVISVYTLKELIWRDWRDEWEPRPSSPSAIRLIHFGRLLDDKLPLKDCRFSDSAPNVVHMSVKPQEVLDDEENAKSAKGKAGSHRAGSSRGDRGDEPTAGCRCIIL